MMKKNQAIYFFFIVFFALLVFFRDPLIAYGIGAAVKRYKQDLGLQFASYTSSSGHLRFKNVTLTKFEGLDCEDLDIYPHLQL